MDIFYVYLLLILQYINLCIFTLFSILLCIIALIMKYCNENVIYIKNTFVNVLVGGIRIKRKNYAKTSVMKHIKAKTFLL